MPKPKKEPAFDPLKWAAQNPAPQYRGPKCLICKKPKAFEQLKAIVDAIDDGRLANYTVIGLLPWLKTEHGLDIRSGTLHRCVREHIRGRR